MAEPKTPKKRRGRPRGSKSKAREATAEQAQPNNPIPPPVNHAAGVVVEPSGDRSDLLPNHEGFNPGEKPSEGFDPGEKPSAENKGDSQGLAADQAKVPSAEVAAIGKLIVDLNGKVQAYQKLAQSMDKTSAGYAKFRENYPKLFDEAVELLWRAKKFGRLVGTWTADPIESGRAGGEGHPMDDSLPSVERLHKEMPDIPIHLMRDLKALDEATTREPKEGYITTVIKEAREDGFPHLPTVHRAITIMHAGRKEGVGGGRRIRSKRDAALAADKRLAAGSDIQRFRNAVLEATSCMPTSTDYWEGLPESEVANTEEIVQKFFDKWLAAKVNAGKRKEHGESHDSLPF